MEYWNSGTMVRRRRIQRILSILNFIVLPTADHLPNIAVSSPSRRLYEPEAKNHFSNIPAFQHSNWGEAPNLVLLLL